MGKFLNVLVGIVLILVALGMLVLSPVFGVNFLQSLVILIEGAIPPFLFMIGIIMLFIGLEEMKSESTVASMPVEPVEPAAPVEEVKEPAYEIKHGKKKKR